MSITTVLRRFMDPPRYHIGPIWLNRAGLQVLRAASSHLAHSCRRPRIQPEIEKFTTAIERDGLVAITDFLPQQDFDRVLAHCRTKLAADGFRVVRNKDGSGTDWFHGPITEDTSEGRWVIERIAGDRRLLSTVEAVARRKITRRPQIIYQRIEVPIGGRHEQDVESTLHADRHFVTVKAYFCLNENRVENGAYVWAPGSHKMTLARLRHEYEYSVRERLALTKGTTGIPAYLLQNGRNAVSPKSFKAMGLREIAVETPANTLVISNNRGFHKRGTLQEGQVREQLRLIFHYLEEPFYTTIAFRAAGLLARRGMLPKSIETKLRQRGFA